MGKFKEYLITEDLGLADIGPRLDKLYHSDYLDSKVGGAFNSGNNAKTSPTLGQAMNLPTTDLTIPSSRGSGRIEFIDMKRNPIPVYLSDGTHVHFSYDEFKRIEGPKPELHKVMTVMFQRHPEDRTQQASKIDKAIVHD